MINRSCFRIDKPGSLKKLKMVTETLEPPGTDEVTVEVRAIGLNYADIFAVLGLYSATPKGSFVPGLEFSGRVITCGPNVVQLKPGDEVFGVSRFGAYATHLNINIQYIMAIPANWTFEQAAAFPVQVLTAYYALVPLGNLKADDTVLIHSAAGGVGLLANRIAKKLGAVTIGVVGHKNKLGMLKNEGYDSGIIRSKHFPDDLAQALRGRELNLVLETTGNQYLKWSYEALAPMGRLVAYGSATYTPNGDRPWYPTLVKKYLRRPKIDPLKMITENKSVLGFNLIWLYEKAYLMHSLMNEIFELELPPPYIGHTFDFPQLPDALRLLQKGETMGKVVVKCDAL